ncbi:MULTISPECIES: helix-turn-helix domain-containing protein [Tsukamurella]|uniref:Helix-turn-helix transcriptional regulator n=2 Tax=Tsukamurella TaxID=2060 RepID=A0A5C5S164_9ACTN|nr:MULTISPECIES: AraC family transcriptional regulator [Tsukamurella]NMD54482.1 helix-turn-helix transcriptional regulator [Tsukamurella columbiensis]TWS28408.1 helix-turn-helix transcriptional regulator [Tsukamurella conjunctivitidis]
MYSEWPSAVPGAVRWTSVGGAGPALVLPDGCMDVIVVDGAPIVAGPDAVAARVEGFGGARIDGLRLPSGMLPQLLGIAADELTGMRVGLADIVPRRRIPRTSDPVALAVALLDGVDLDPRIGAIAARLRAGRTVGEIASEAGLGERALHRLSRRSFGYGPKTLARIQRFQRAVGPIRAGRALAEVAASSGYADQAHLTREVKALTGSPPTALRRVTS